MLQVLRTHGLQVVQTPTTHTQGAALDVHITSEAWKCTEHTHTFEHKLSDRSLSSLQTDLQVRTAQRTQKGVDNRTSPQITWDSNATRCREAKTTEHKVMEYQAQMFQCVALSLSKTQPMWDCRPGIVDLATIIMNVACARTGHPHNLIQGKRHARKETPATKEMKFLFEEAALRYAKAKVGAEAQPGQAKGRSNANQTKTSREGSYQQ